MLQFDHSVLSYRGSERVHGKMLAALKPRADYLVSQWADRDRILSSRHAKQHGKWKTSRVPFIREPMDALSSRSHVRIVTLMKGAQISGTESAQNWVGYSIISDPVPMLFVCPTLTVLKRTSARIQQMVDDDPEGLGTKILPARKRDSKNSEREKHYPGGALYFATARSATNLRSTMVERMILDEVDAYPDDVEGEGSVIAIAEARGTTAGDAFKQFEISTPGLEATSLIKKRYLKGDQRKHFMPCPHCQTLINFEWENFVWQEGKPSSVRYRCQHCSTVGPHYGLIHEGKHKADMLTAGVWIPKVLSDDPEAMAQIAAGDHARLDEHNRNSFHWSYWLPSFYATIGLTWRRIIERWEAAQGSAAELVTIWNTVFGLPYSPPGEAPSWEAVRNRKVTLRARAIPEWATFLTGSADPGTDHVEIGVWAYGRRRRRHMVEHVRIDGDPADPEVWEQVEAFKRRLYLHPCGAVMDLRRFVVDRNHRPDLVDRWLATQDRLRVMGIMGSKTFDAQLVTWARRREKPDDAEWGGDSTFQYIRGGVSVGKLEWFSDLHQRHVEGQAVPQGWVTLNADTTDEWCKQSVSERLDYIGAKGMRKSPRFVDNGGSRHEALDVTIYCRIGAEVEGWSRWGSHDFDREEKKMHELSERIQVEIERLASERHLNGDPRPITIRDLYPTLVLPEEEPTDSHALPIEAAAARTKTESVDTPDEDIEEVEIVPAPVEIMPVPDVVEVEIAPVPEVVLPPPERARTWAELNEEALYAGVAKGWGPQQSGGWGDQADALSPTGGKRFVGCSPALEDLLSNSVSNADD